MFIYFNLGQKKNGYYYFAALTIESDGPTNVVFKILWTNNVTASKSAPNRNFLWMYCHLLNIIWIIVISYNIVIHPKIRLVTKDEFLDTTEDLFKTLQILPSGQIALPKVIEFIVLNSPAHRPQ